MAEKQDDGFAAALTPDSLLHFDTYDDYLDSKVVEEDEFYLEDKELARELVKLGVRGGGVLTRENFNEQRRIELQPTVKKKRVRKLVSEGKDLSGFPVLEALAEREDLVRNGKLSVILFLRHKNRRNQEVSGYIDYAHRLKTEPFEQYFDIVTTRGPDGTEERKPRKKLMPNPSDLSYYNWETQTCDSNDTENFHVIAEFEEGLRFKNKRDRKLVYVDPKSHPGDNSQRIELTTDEHYMQAVIYEHMTRQKS
tara:strand:+ start:1785 stop:2540 length:756 start_codon:yes stop_codon:yes gene_type:complete